MTDTPQRAPARRALLLINCQDEFRPGDYLMNRLRRHASVAGSQGAQRTKALPLAGIPYFPKWAGSAFVNPDLDAWLRAHAVEPVLDAIACGSDASRALARLQGKGARSADARHDDPLLENGKL